MPPKSRVGKLLRREMRQIFRWLRGYFAIFFLDTQDLSFIYSPNEKKDLLSTSINNTEAGENSAGSGNHRRINSLAG